MQLHRTFTRETSLRSSTSFALNAAGCWLAAVLVAGAATTNTTEYFDDESTAADHGWMGLGNVDNGQNFGFRPSDMTGGASPGGEAGGTFVRRLSVAYYGDTTLGGIFTLNDPLHAEGELATANNAWDGNLRLGFFNTASGGQTTLANVLGLNIAEPGGGFPGYRASAVCINSTRTEAYSTLMDLSPLDGTFRFRFDYVPTGNGSLTMELFGSDGTSLGTRTLNLTAAQRAAGATFDAFGLIVGAMSDREVQLDVYLDAVTYTTLPPNQPPSVVIQPLGRRVSEGADVTFTVLANGTPPLGYQWRFNGEDIFLADATSYTISGVQFANSGDYDVVVANDFGSVTSAVAKLVVTLPFTEHFDDASTVLEHGWTGVGNTANGQNFGFRESDVTGGVSPAGEAGGTFVRRLSVAYYGDTTLGGTFTLNDTLHAEGELATANNAWDGDLRIGFFNTASGGQTTLANVLGLNLAEPGGGFPGYRVSAVCVNAGRTAAYSSAMDLSPLDGAFRFRFDYVPTGNGSLTVELFSSDGTSLNTRTLNLSAAQRAAGATFDAFGLIVGAMSERSVQLDLFVDEVTYTTMPEIQPPTLITHPLSQKVPLGSEATFSVTASGTAPLRYQWRLNGAILPGANAASYTIANVQFTHAGSYDVVVTNVFGSVTSLVATLAVTTLATEDFDDLASAVSHGWADSGNMTDGNSFGFSDSNVTGGTPGGEAGGTFARSMGVRYYGDTTLGGTFTLNDVLHAEGELATEINGWDGDLRIGFFNTASGGLNTLANVLGANIAEPGGGISGYRATATLATENAATAYAGALELSPLTGTFRFRFDYVPTGGANSQGQLTVEFFNSEGASVGTRTLHLTSAQRTVGANFNAFGLIIGGHGSSIPTALLNAYIDAVSYTTVLTSPPTVTSKPMLPLTPLAGGWLVSFEGWPGLTYQLQRAAHITGPWLTLTNLSVGAPGRASFADTNAPPPRAFYRTVYP